VSALPAVRAVVDSNLVIRGLLRRRPRSVAVRLLDAAIDGRFQLVLSLYLLAEVEQTLREPAVRALRKLTDSQIKGFIGALAEVAQVVKGAYAAKSRRSRSRRQPGRRLRPGSRREIRRDGRSEAPAAHQGRSRGRVSDCPDREPD